MVVGAHAFDAEIMAGASVRKHVCSGGTASLVHMTLGERGHPVLGPAVYASQKRRESAEAACRLGADVVIGPFADGSLVDDMETTAWLEAVIVMRKPTHVVTHNPGSIHEDHHACANAVLKAVFRAGLPSRTGGSHTVSGLYFGENWEDPIGFERHIFVDVSGVEQEWEEAMNAYELFAVDSHLSAFRYRQYYTALRRSVGALIGVDAAEAFMLPPLGLRRVAEGLCDPAYRLTGAANIIRHPSGAPSTK